MTDSQQLLAEYARSGSEAAFRELVSRHVDLVYSTALRLVGGDTHRAEDVAQIVFADLARQARTLSAEVMPGGWLHRHTCFVAANTLRGERRRQFRERQAVEMNALQNDSRADFSLVAPILDDAINELDEADRNAILLRFFEQRDFRSVGEALGSNEDAARMRVNRALEKLHSLLERRGVTTTAAALSVALAANAVLAAPAGLAAAISTAAVVAGSSLVTATTAVATKTITMTTLHKIIIGAALVASVGTGVYQTLQASRLRSQVLELQEQQIPLVDQIAQLKNDNERLSNRVAQASQSLSLSSDRLRELLRLRGEVGMLRRQQRELEQAIANRSVTSGLVTHSAADAPTNPGRPMPFQVQLVCDEAGEDTETLTNSSSGSRGETLHVQKRPLMDFTSIRSASVTTHTPTGEPQISVEFNEVGKELFAAITKENINKRLAIVVDGHLYSAPVIRTEIPGGKAIVAGSFTEEEARELAARINDAISGSPSGQTSAE